MQVLTRWSWGLPESRQGKVRRGLIRALFVVVILWAGYGLLAGDAGLLRIMALNRRTSELSAEVASLETDTRELQKKRDLMLSEPSYLEKVSREEYGLARDGEIVYRFDSGTPETGLLTALYPDSVRAKMVKAAIDGDRKSGGGGNSAVAEAPVEPAGIAPQEEEQPGLAIDSGPTEITSPAGKTTHRTTRRHRSTHTR